MPAPTLSDPTYRIESEIGSGGGGVVYKALHTRMASLLLLIVLLTSLLTGCSGQTAQTAAELLDLGEKYLLDLDYEQALVQFLKVIEIEPMIPRGYTGAAEAYVGLDRIPDAIAILEKGLEIIGPEESIQGMLDELRGKATEPPPSPTVEDTPEATPIVVEELSDEELQILREISSNFKGEDLDEVDNKIQKYYSNIIVLYNHIPPDTLFLFGNDQLIPLQSGIGLVIKEINEIGITVWYGTFREALPSGTAICITSMKNDKYFYTKATWDAGRANGIVEHGGFDSTGESRYRSVCNYINGFANGIRTYSWNDESWEYELQNGAIILSDRFVWKEEEGYYVLDGNENGGGLLFYPENFNEFFDETAWK